MQKPLLGIASKIEPPTHSHGILISSTLLITEKTPSLKITKSHSIFSCSNVSPFYHCQSLVLVSTKGSKVQGYQIPACCLSRDCTQITLFIIRTKAKIVLTTTKATNNKNTPHNFRYPLPICLHLEDIC